ncbi:carcinoembryonic antigen-related cell adhesion molecule 5 isoform X1 [Kryptolebias marmoratus]|uniref:carcinoembryonic antigen-related cell adhesion molecule 5 isoform X1 n=1 Tax=Kryptolebias marmoratus TaxID=37003 RepID=UPI000D530E2D|nr:carcinoembryonic antigen-related cell adhesion molecule 5 isoform X1 [Kryptolebias marmoratus]
MLLILFTVAVVFTGFSEGSGVLPDGPLNASVGGTVMFRTNVAPTEKPFLLVSWMFGDSEKLIINSLPTENSSAPEYKDRITLFRFTGSLELGDLKLSDSGKYSVLIAEIDGNEERGSTWLDIYAPVSSVTVVPQTTDLVEFNSSVRLSCSSSGSSLSFLWMNSSSELTASDRVQITDGGSNLTIINVTRYDQGPVSCQVSNPVSNATSEPVKLSISYGPENIQLNVSLSKEHYEEGSDISLSCSAESKPSAEFMWFLDGNLLPDFGPELRLMNIKTNQSGNYSCQAFNSKTLRYQTSQPLSVFVLERISSVTVVPPTTDLVEFNSSVRLSCSSSGSSLSFLWMNSSSELTASDRVQITDGGSTLTIINVTRYDQGPYTCNVSNPISNATSEPVNIFVNYGPENIQLNVSLSKEHYEEGSDISLSCSAESKPSAEFIWFLDGNLLPDSGPELRLMDVQTSQSGNYSCQAFNSKTLRYQTSQTSSVSVIARISNVVLKSDTKDLLEFSSSVSLFCSSSGSSPSFIWMNSSSDLTANNRVQINTTDGGSTLTIINVTRYDQGPYSCHVSNPISAAISDPVNLFISYGPEKVELTVSPPRQNFEEGSDIVLSCSADSRPAATFRWFLNQRLLPDLGPELRLMNVKMNQSGNYSCQAFNNKTQIYEASHSSVISVYEGSSGLSGDIIAIIVIVCLVLVAGVGVGYCVYRNKKHGKESSSRNIFTITGGKRQKKAANASEELNYADLKFSKNKKGTTNPVELEDTLTNYAEVKVNNRPAASSSSTNNQEQNYVNIRLPENNRGMTAQGELQNASSNYAQTRVNNTKPLQPPPLPPTYGAHVQRGKRPAPQPRVFAQTSPQNLNYADPEFPENQNERAVQVEVKITSTNYAPVRENSSRPPAPPPPTYKAHMQRENIPPPPAVSAQVYAQVSQRR